MDELILELKKEIISALNLEGMQLEDIDENAPLFQGGLDLDSIDALEIIDKHYGIKLNDPRQSKEIFTSVASIADYVSKHRTK